MNKLILVLAPFAFTTTPYVAAAGDVDIGLMSFPGAADPSVENGSISSFGLSPGDSYYVPVEDIWDAVGKGYDPITNTVLEPCVLPTQKDVIWGENRFEGVDYKNTSRLVKNITTHEAASASNMEFGFTYKIFSLGASTESTRGDYFNSIDSYFRLYNEAITKGRRRDRDYMWEEGVRRLLAKTDLKDFLRRCGTGFVRTVKFGHRLDLTYRFTLRDMQAAKTRSVGLSSSIGEIFSAGGGTSAREKTVQDISTNTFMDFGRGVYAHPATSVMGEGGLVNILSYADFGFIAAVKSDVANTQARPLMAEIQPYRSDVYLKDVDRIPTWTDEITKYMVDLLPLVTDLQGQMSELDYALTPPLATQTMELYGEDKASVEKKQSVARSMLLALEGASNICRELISGDEEDNAFIACKTALDSAINPQKVKDISVVRAP